MKHRKPTLIKPITPKTRATVSSGNCRLNMATAKVHNTSISLHNSREPSCPPQVPAMR